MQATELFLKPTVPRLPHPNRTRYPTYTGDAPADEDGLRTHGGAAHRRAQRGEVPQVVAAGPLVVVRCVVW
jgi:hypothetical protein